MKLTPAIQESLLALLLFDETSAGETAALVPPESFDPYFAELAEEGVKYLREYRQPAGEHTLDIINLLGARREKAAPFYKRIYESILQTRKGINREYVLGQASQFLRYQRLRRGLTAAVGALQSNANDSIPETERVLREALGGSYELFDPGMTMKDPDRVLRFMDRAESPVEFPTGIKLLDDRGLHPSRKTLHTFAGRTGTGKTWYLLHLAKNAILEQKSVVYVSLELSEDKISQRLVQSFFGVTKRQSPTILRRFERDDLGRFISLEEENWKGALSFDQDGARTKLARRLRQFNQLPDLVVKQFPDNSLTHNDLELYLDALEGSRKIVPDLLIIDQAGNMRLSPKDYRISVGQAFRGLRGIMVKRNLAGATACQTNRAAASRLWTTVEFAAESDQIGQCVDTMVTYNQTQAERELGLARLFVAKGRDDADKFGFVISQNYELGQFVLDEVGLVDAYWDAVDPKLKSNDDDL